MDTVHAQHRSSTRRTPRLWIVETLVVLGVLGFGYFALTLDSAKWQNPSQPADPLAELVGR